MGGSAANLGQQFRDSVPDEGFWVDLPNCSLNQLREENGNIVTTATTPVLVLSSDWIFAKWAAGNADAAYLLVQLGRELANTPSKVAATINKLFPRLRLTLSARMDGVVGPDVPALTVTAKCRSFTGAIKATFTANFKASFQGGPATNALSNQTNCLPLTFDFFETSGTGPVYIEPGDQLVVKIVPAAHANDAIELHGLRMQAKMNNGYTDPRLRV